VFRTIEELAEQKMDEKRISEQIRKIKKKTVVIVYGHTSYSSYVPRVVELLQNRAIDAEALSVGWNEFRHFKNLWVPESVWDSFDLDLYLDGQSRESQ
jgi:glycerol dehydrogenase-like iron-containing ADH family enzyme